MTAVQLSFLTFVSTSLGGICALRFRDRLHMVLGFSAGVILGIVAFDVLPEIFRLSSREGSDGRAAMLGLVAGFVLFHGLEKFVLVHSVHEDEYAEHRHPRVGVLSALALIGHSFMDGVASGSHSRRRLRWASRSRSPSSRTTSATASTPSDS